MTTTNPRRRAALAAASASGGHSKMLVLAFALLLIAPLLAGCTGRSPNPEPDPANNDGVKAKGAAPDFLSAYGKERFADSVGPISEASLFPSPLSLNAAVASNPTIITGARPNVAACSTPVSRAPSGAVFDVFVQRYFARENVTAATLAVSNACGIVYERGYGTMGERPWARSYPGIGASAQEMQAHASEPVPADTMWRIASVSKTLTAGVIQTMIKDGTIAWNDRVFCPTATATRSTDGVRCLLNIAPANMPDGRPGTVAPATYQMTVGHLIQHLGGWHTGTQGEFMLDDRGAARRTNTAMPVNTEAFVRLAIASGIGYPPGGPTPVNATGAATSGYSNLGYSTLGLIADRHAQGGYMGQLRRLMESAGASSDDLDIGHAEAARINAREPLYPCGTMMQSAYVEGAQACGMYGGYNVEAGLAGGAVVTTARALALYMTKHWVEFPGSDLAGTARPNAYLPLPRNMPGAHNGGIPAVRSVVVQCTNGINIAFLTNTFPDSGNSSPWGSMWATLCNVSNDFLQSANPLALFTGPVSAPTVVLQGLTTNAFDAWTLQAREDGWAPRDLQLERALNGELRVTSAWEQNRETAWQVAFASDASQLYARTEDARSNRMRPTQVAAIRDSYGAMYGAIYAPDAGAAWSLAAGVAAAEIEAASSGQYVQALATDGPGTVLVVRGDAWSSIQRHINPAGLNQAVQQAEARGEGAVDVTADPSGDGSMLVVWRPGTVVRAESSNPWLVDTLAQSRAVALIQPTATLLSAVPTGADGGKVDAGESGKGSNAAAPATAGEFTWTSGALSGRHSSAFVTSADIVNYAVRGTAVVERVSTPFTLDSTPLITGQIATVGGTSPSGKTGTITMSDSPSGGMAVDCHEGEQVSSWDPKSSDLCSIQFPAGALIQGKEKASTEHREGYERYDAMIDGKAAMIYVHGPHEWEGNTVSIQCNLYVVMPGDATAVKDAANHERPALTSAILGGQVIGEVEVLQIDGAQRLGLAAYDPEMGRVTAPQTRQDGVAAFSANWNGQDARALIVNVGRNLLHPQGETGVVFCNFHVVRVQRSDGSESRMLQVTEADNLADALDGSEGYAEAFWVHGNDGVQLVLGLPQGGTYSIQISPEAA